MFIKLATTKAISNCLLSPTSESLADFQFGAYLKSIILNCATNHSRTVVKH